MGKIFSVVVGLGIIGYLMYVLMLVVPIIVGTGSETWQGVSLHLIATGILFVIVLVGYFWGSGQEKATEAEKQSAPIAENAEKAPPTSSYNPIEDQLYPAVYRQHFTTWWYDNDGDKHDQGTLFATLRFYEEGTILAIRALSIPKIEVPDSFTMKGSYVFDKGKLTLSLKKVSDVDDLIEINLSDEDLREMNYYGEFADNNSLIKEGNYEGRVKGKTIRIGNFTFQKLPALKLIVTADEDTCEGLEQRVKNHPYVISTFQDTGNWYTNGETGPEWFTLHIETWEDWKEETEALVRAELKKMEDSANNLFWDRG